MKNPNHHKKECPEGWTTYNDTWRYLYPECTDKMAWRQDRVEYEKRTGNSYFQIFGYSKEEVNESITKRMIIEGVRKIVPFGKYILVITQMQSKTYKDTYKIRVQLHCILKEVPTQEQLKNIKRVCTTYNF